MRADYRPEDQRIAQARLAATARAAQRAGVGLEEYERRRAEGDKFCFGHESWHPVGEFGQNVRRADGLDSRCKASRRAESAAAAPRARGRDTRELPRQWDEIPSQAPPDPDPTPTVAVDVDASFLRDPRRACRGMPVDTFYPDRRVEEREAKAVCGPCLVREQCLRWAIAIGDDVAVLGGLLPAERRRLRREQGALAC